MKSDLNNQNRRMMERYRTVLGAVLIGMLPCLAHAQIQRIVLQGSGGPQVFEQIDDALAAAQANDKIYFSGGTFPAPDGFTIDVPLHFIGAGIHPDSTGVTGITTLTSTGSSADFRFMTGASGSSFTGIHFNPGGHLYYGSDGSNDDAINMTFQRCRFSKGVHLGQVGPSTSSSSFDECIFHSNLRGDGGAATVTRCIFDLVPGTGTAVTQFQPSGLVVSNSVFLSARIGNSHNAMVTNSIFTSPSSAPLWQSNGSVVTNCLISASEVFSNTSGGVSTNNQLNVPANEIFVNEADAGYQFTDDLHLVASSPGVNAGNDGNDIGIYGSNSPYKPGAVPYNPHFVEADIAPATDGSGNLPVNIKVSAQPN